MGLSLLLSLYVKQDCTGNGIAYTIGYGFTVVRILTSNESA